MTSVSRFTRLLISSIAILIVLGCATDLSRIQVNFVPAAASENRAFIVARDVIVSPLNSYQRTLKGGSVWKYVGTIPQGSVYEIKDDVFLLEAKHMHQAHCVLSGASRLVGFYLPVEQAFVALSPPVELPVQFK